MKRFGLALAFIVSVLFYLSVCASAREENTNRADPSSQQSQQSSGTAKVFSFPLVNDGQYKEPRKADPVDMAYEFFELNKEYFHMQNPKEELVVKREVRDELGAMISFTQLYKGMPLLHSDVRTHFTPEGKLKYMQGTYHYDIDLPTTPQIDSATAERRALKDLDFPADAVVRHSERFSTRLSIWRSGQGKFHLVWVLWVKQEMPLHLWRYYIDALDGAVLYKVDEVSD